ncbi:MAG: hypothetical protein KKH08_02600 [Candidatus Omnitrophica bacterium]|nr:hypothetical protein [Candidatus Omnitrophota bacterium]
MQMALLFFTLGGLTLGFSLLFFLAPQQIHSRQLDMYFGQKAKNEGLEGIMNQVYSIEDKINLTARAMGMFLIVMTLIFFWTGWSLGL